MIDPDTIVTLAVTRGEITQYIGQYVLLAVITGFLAGVLVALFWVWLWKLDKKQSEERRNNLAELNYLRGEHDAKTRVR